LYVCTFILAYAYIYSYSTFHICHSLYYDAVCHRNLINEYMYIDL